MDNAIIGVALIATAFGFILGAYASHAVERSNRKKVEDEIDEMGEWFNHASPPNYHMRDQDKESIFHRRQAG